MLTEFGEREREEEVKVGSPGRVAQEQSAAV
jgi:hypothetical protein